MKTTKIDLKVLQETIEVLNFIITMLIIFCTTMQLVFSKIIEVPIYYIFEEIWKTSIPIYWVITIIYIILKRKSSKIEKTLKHSIGTEFKKIKVKSDFELYPILKDEEVFLKRDLKDNSLFIMRVIFHDNKGNFVQKNYTFKEEKFDFIEEVLK